MFASPFPNPLADDTGTASELVNLSQNTTKTVFFKGMNLKKSSTFEVYYAGTRVKDTTISVSDLFFLNEKDLSMWDSPNRGSSASKTTQFSVSQSTSIPTSVEKEMFLTVVGPPEHDNFGKHRRITNVTSGFGGKIIVDVNFPSTLEGCEVKVTKRKNTGRFVIKVGSDSKVGKRDLLLIAYDGQKFLLKTAFEIV